MDEFEIIATSCAAVFGVASFTVAGLARAIFESVLFHDTPKLHLGEYYSHQLFESAKDRNNDGRISYMERAFPKDGGHFAKRVEYAAIAIGMLFMCMFCVMMSATWFILLLMPVVYFLVASLSFELFYGIFRYPPKY